MAKYTIELAPKGEKTLAKVARTLEVSKADAIRRSLGVMDILTEAVEQGGKVIIEDANGNRREIIGV